MNLNDKETATIYEKLGIKVREFATAAIKPKIKSNGEFTLDYADNVWGPLMQVDQDKQSSESQFNFSIDGTPEQEINYLDVAKSLKDLAMEPTGKITTQNDVASATMYTKGDVIVFVFKSKVQGNDTTAWIFPKDLSLDEAKRIVNPTVSTVKKTEETVEEKLQDKENEFNVRTFEDIVVDRKIEDGSRSKEPTVKLSDSFAMELGQNFRNVSLNIYYPDSISSSSPSGIQHNAAIRAIGRLEDGDSNIPDTVNAVLIQPKKEIDRRFVIVVFNEVDPNKQLWLFSKDVNLSEIRQIVNQSGQVPIVNEERQEKRKTKPIQKESEKKLNRDIQNFALQLQSGINISEIPARSEIRDWVPEGYEGKLTFDITDLGTDGKDAWVNFPTEIQSIITKHLTPQIDSEAVISINSKAESFGKRRSKYPQKIGIDFDFANVIQEHVDYLANKNDQNSNILFAWFLDDTAKDKLIIRVVAITPGITLKNISDKTMEFTIPKYDSVDVSEDVNEDINTEIRTDIRNVYPEIIYTDATNNRQLFNLKQFNQLRYNPNDDYKPMSHLMEQSGLKSVDLSEIKDLGKYLKSKVMSDSGKSFSEFFIFNPFLNKTESIQYTPSKEYGNAEFQAIANSIALAMDYYRDKSKESENGVPQYQIKEQGDYWRIDIIFVKKNGDVDPDHHFVISSDPNLNRVKLNEPFNIIDLGSDKKEIFYQKEFITPVEFERVNIDQLFEFLNIQGFERCQIETLTDDLKGSFNDTFYKVIENAMSQGKPNQLTIESLEKALVSYPNLAIKNVEGSIPPQILVLNITNPDIYEYEEVLLFTQAPSIEYAYRAGRHDLLETHNLDTINFVRGQKLYDEIWLKVMKESKLSSEMVDEIRKNHGATTKSALKEFARQKLYLYLFDFQNILRDEYNSLTADPENIADTQFAEWMIKDYPNLDLSDQLHIIAFQQFKNGFVNDIQRVGSNKTGDDMINFLLGSEFDPDDEIDGNFKLTDIFSVVDSLEKDLETTFANDIVIAAFKAKKDKILTPTPKARIQEQGFYKRIGQRLLGKPESSHEDISIEEFTQTIFSALEKEFHQKLFNSFNQEQLDEVLKQAYIGILNQNVEEDIFVDNLSPMQVSAAQIIIDIFSRVPANKKKDNICIFNSKINESHRVKVFSILIQNDRNPNSLPGRFSKEIKLTLSRLEKDTENDNSDILESLDPEFALFRKVNREISREFNITNPERFPIEKFLEIITSKEDSLIKVVLEAYLEHSGIIIQNSGKSSNRSKDFFETNPQSTRDLIQNIDVANRQQKKLNKLRNQLAEAIQSQIDENPKLASLVNDTDFLDTSDEYVYILPNYWNELEQTLESALQEIQIARNRAIEVLKVALLDPKSQKDKDKIDKIIKKYFKELDEKEAIINSELSKKYVSKYVRKTIVPKKSRENRKNDDTRRVDERSKLRNKLTEQNPTSSTAFIDYLTSRNFSDPKKGIAIKYSLNRVIKSIDNDTQDYDYISNLLTNLNSDRSYYLNNSEEVMKIITELDDEIQKEMIKNLSNFK